MRLFPYPGAVALLLAGLWVGSAAGQIQQFPPTIMEPAVPGSAAPVVSDPGPWLGPPPMQFQGPIQGPVIGGGPPTGEIPQNATPPPTAEVAPPEIPEGNLPRDVRNGVFQKVSVDGSWISPDPANGFGMTDLDAKGVFALPMPSRQWPLLIIPEFASHWLAAPQKIDLPTNVYDADIEFRWLPQVTQRLMLNLSVTPGVYRQFGHDTDPGWRTTVDAAAVWSWTPTTRVVLGASYRDRSNENFIPIGGLLWYPNEEFKADLLFPAPKVQHRVYWFGEYGTTVEDWAYVAGEYGDWIWAFQRADGQQDMLSYRDCRFFLGLERKIHGGLDWKAEIGYVFARQVRSASGLSNYDPSGGLLLRTGLTY